MRPAIPLSFSLSIAATSALPTLRPRTLLSLLRTRAPHFANIISPVPGYVLLVPSSNTSSPTTEGATEANSTLDSGLLQLTYRNGERADETTLSVSLANQSAIYLIADALPFVDNWYTVNTTIPISYADFADGNYTLLTQEYFENEVTSELEQPFYITHDAALASALTAAQNDTLSPSSGSDSFSPGGGGGSGGDVLGTVAGQAPLSTSTALPTVTVVQSGAVTAGGTTAALSESATGTSSSPPMAQESSFAAGSIQEGLAGLAQDLEGSLKE